MRRPNGSPLRQNAPRGPRLPPHTRHGGPAHVHHGPRQNGRTSALPKMVHDALGAVLPRGGIADRGPRAVHLLRVPPPERGDPVQRGAAVGGGGVAAQVREDRHVHREHQARHLLRLDLLHPAPRLGYERGASGVADHAVDPQVARHSRRPHRVHARGGRRVGRGGVAGAVPQGHLQRGRRVCQPPRHPVVGPGVSVPADQPRAAHAAARPTQGPL
mmetsp:Transcript_3677/g.8748  ORF Transcript_3677/g.8748 Transcript_3677/m.8748 type:complete len:216 (-) Transcript_3677:273-920(-)